MVPESIKNVDIKFSTDAAFQMIGKTSNLKVCISKTGMARLVLISNDVIVEVLCKSPVAVSLQLTYILNHVKYSNICLTTFTKWPLGRYLCYI